MTHCHIVSSFDFHIKININSGLSTISYRLLFNTLERYLTGTK